ncbi:MAG: flagellar hook-basal body complex protein [Rhodospirillum sp.]|nr:flagellar hook-basal body complex protein [Rhodospirillum sp.]MCF8491181.1 flagellar hook-basal body complex protein [Rhodospirillum sp.]MCF8499623.1 flagellar hook-basal body complex protein [Rhodospirillum sp.]
MSLWGAFTNSSMAMNAQSHALGQISTNVTNINTTGYKQVDTNFKTLLSESSASYDFFGVKPVDYRRVSQQGSILQTGRSMDVAVGGSGMFMVNPQQDMSGETFYTRDGSFQARVDGETGNSYLTTVDGYYLMGWEADSAAYQAGDDPFPANDPTTEGVTGDAVLGPIQLNSFNTVDGMPTSEVVLRANIDADARTPQTLGLSVWGSETTVTNTDGTTSSSWPRQSVMMQFEPDLTTKNTWSLSLTDPNGGTGTATPSTLVFDGSGNLTTPTDGMVTFDMTYPNGTTGAFTVDMTDLSQFGGNTQIYETDVNGYAEGMLSSTAFDDEGVLTGTFTNGTTRPLYKVALADFTADDSLALRSQNLYGATAEAGDRRVISVSNVLNGGTRLTPGALEQSNVDLTDQFSRMMTTQTAYSSAANVFRTADEMSQTAAGLKK